MNTPITSKINWTQIVSLGAVLGSLIGLDLTAETQVQIVSFIAVATPLITMIWRTWFNK